MGISDTYSTSLMDAPSDRHSRRVRLPFKHWDRVGIHSGMQSRTSSRLISYNTSDETRGAQCYGPVRTHSAPQTPGALWSHGSIDGRRVTPRKVSQQ